mmetsp:Transcript_2875/g.4924  ORF Transcript_2875/g.4924 Transcript_2875/m.4924 type:complete len:82 (-) Transcript_2875:134-379(-)
MDQFRFRLRFGSPALMRKAAAKAAKAAKAACAVTRRVNRNASERHTCEKEVTQLLACPRLGTVPEPGFSEIRRPSWLCFAL